MAMPGIYIALEQPATRLLLKHPMVHDALAAARAPKVTIGTRSFNGTSQKPLALCGTAPWLEDLQEASREGNRDRDLQVPLCDRTETAVKGKTHELKASEEYTADFTDSWLQVIWNIQRLIVFLSISVFKILPKYEVHVP